MKHSVKLEGGVVYEFSDEEEYQGAKFVSIKKVSTFKEQKKYQVLTIKPTHWEEFKKFMTEILDDNPNKAPF